MHTTHQSSTPGVNSGFRTVDCRESPAFPCAAALVVLLRLLTSAILEPNATANMPSNAVIEFVITNSLLVWRGVRLNLNERHFWVWRDPLTLLVCLLCFRE
jgi:hypothetical protein